MGEFTTLPLGQEYIEHILPHRKKAQLIDKITKLEPGSEVECIVELGNKKFLTDGHFPGKIIVPGHYLSEMGNLACAIIILSLSDNYGKLPILTETQTWFRKPVNPKIIKSLRIKAKIEMDGIDQIGFYTIYAGAREMASGRVRCKLISKKGSGGV